MMEGKIIILGAGMTGLAAGYASGLPVYEAEEAPGGICSSYYVKPGSNKRLHKAPKDGEAYRFEIGGGTGSLAVTRWCFASFFRLSCNVIL